MTVFLYNQYICYESLTPTYSVQNLTLLNTVHSFDDDGFPIQPIHMLRKLNAIAYIYILAGFHNIYLLIKRRIHRACIHRVPMGNSYIHMRNILWVVFSPALLPRVLVAQLVVEIPDNGLLCRLAKVRFPFTVSPVQSCCHEEGHGEGDPVFVWHAAYVRPTTFLKHKTFDIRKLISVQVSI